MMIGIFSVQNIAVAEESSYKSFYSTENKPLFYGATEITIDKNVVSTFDEKDARFRIMARDFEDGDLTYKIICTKNNVVPTTAGEYELIYSVTDSHKNTSTITVPVHVLDKEEGECKIVRTIYSIPSLWNLSLVGTERCNNGDRQILGIYLPESTSAEIRSIDAEADLQITYLTNTKVKNSFSSVKISNTDFQTVKNVASDGNSYAAVPLITSPRLKTNEIDKTFKIEIKFKEDVKALDYYHYKDDEQAFKDDWKASQNSFGVVDGEAMILVVPFADVDKLSGYTAPNYNSPFASLDAFFEFYLEVVNRYDKMLGLEFDAKEEIDQNFRIKYTAVADASSSAGAYYAGGYIAVCRDTISPIFQYGWGTLHEIARGYQGTLGRGVGGGENLCLNETGNNILAHYIQMDESIYLNPNKSKYLGKLENAEQNQNQSRYNKIADGTGVFNNSGGTYTNITEKMFCIINLLDKFEGPETYGKLFKYYRRIVQKYGNNTFRISDVYAKFFAEEYNVNIIPYLKAWTMTLSENVEAELFEKDLKVMNIFADILSETNFEKISTDNNFNLKFGLYDESVLDDYNIKTNLNLNLEIDNFNEIKGRYLAVIKNNEVVKTVKIINKNLQITDLPVGYQQILLPYDFGMNNKLCSFVLKEGENSVSYKFEEYGTPKFSEYKSTIKIFGIYNTVGLSVEFDNFYKTAKFTPGGADLGNRNATWAGKMD